MLFALTTVPGGGGQAGFPPHQSDRPPWTTGEEETAGVAVIIAPFVLRLHFCVAAVGLPALRVRGGLGVVACYHYGGVGILLPQSSDLTIVGRSRDQVCTASPPG